jgi:hypothetical protein
VKAALFAVFIFSFSCAYGSDYAKYDLGVINDLVSDGANLYYFEAEKDLKSAVWAKDTKVKVDDGKKVQNVSEKLFIHPTELNQDHEYLYFASLSEKCTDQILCDYQDIYKMSKKDGSFTVLAEDLRSSIHISLENDSLYISESTGKIWKINHQNGSKEAVVQTNDIIMDVVSKNNIIYWIEEIAEQNSRVLTLKGTATNTVAENLQIPYDLTVQNDVLYWNEIQVKAVEGDFAEVTSIESYNGQSKTLMEFENTSPVSVSLNKDHYSPYLVSDDYLFLINNTNDDSVIQMINLYNSTVYDVGTISDYDAKYLRTDGNHLFVVGTNENGFVIDKHVLPVKVPEFPSVLLMMLPLALAPVLILQRFWRS